MDHLLNYLLENCTLCPRKCSVNRLAGERGYCGAGTDVNIARAALHHWEEPCLSGDHGSGTVFFSFCPMRCVYCQNALFDGQKGTNVTQEDMARVFLRLQNQTAHNINLVTPTHYMPQIVSAIRLARQEGLSIPIVYNTSGYETVEAIKSLNDSIDIFLPDIKYYDDRFARKYSGVADYFRHASSAVRQMVRQTGPALFDNDGLMQRGVLIRHMVLPGLVEDSKKIIRYVYDTFGDSVYISIMNQYTPLRGLERFPELKRTVSQADYRQVVDFALALGVVNGFIQEEGAINESFIPEFNGL